MNYFIDTNVPIGYTIPHDKFHKSSVNFIENTSDPIYWSTLVKKEYGDTLESIVDNVENYLHNCRSILKNNEKDFSNYLEFEKFIIQRTEHCELDNYKKTKILEVFWMKNDFIEGISEEIKIKFTDFSRDMRKIYYNRDSTLKNILILHDCGLDNYLKYYDYVKQLYQWGVHKPDCKIIADAHDCGLTHDDLVFITNDVKMLESISRMDTSHLKIIEFRSCN